MPQSTTTTNTPSFWAKVRTVILVSFLAILIWLLAESRMVQTRMVELQIVLIGNSQDPQHRYVVRPAIGEHWTASIDVELEGSLASLDQASRDLRGRVQLLVGDQIPSRPGIHDLDLKSILRNLTPLHSLGVSIRSLSTDLVKVQVDELVSIQLPVRVDLPPSVALDGPVRAIPQTISIQGPASFIATLEGREILATLSPNSIAPLTPGRLETIPGVALTLPTIPFDSSSSPPGWTPVLSPSRVDVRLTVRSLTQTTVIDRLPIQVLLAPGEVGRWIVALDPGSEDLVSIQISGPSDALASIADGSKVPAAILSLSFQDLERGISTKQVSLLGLPESVQILSDMPDISFTISPVAAPIRVPAQDPATATP
ncbi:MAG: hypothetical protein JKY43_08905 [Phycisphaerales bacterium]|nr:hypothetical protein [Phycisphaerales bacterium]